MKAEKFLKDIERIKEKENFDKLSIKLERFYHVYADKAKVDNHLIKFILQRELSLLMDIDDFENLDYTIGGVKEGYLRVTLNKKAL